MTKTKKAQNISANLISCAFLSVVLRTHTKEKINIITRLIHVMDVGEFNRY